MNQPTGRTNANNHANPWKSRSATVAFWFPASTEIGIGDALGKKIAVFKNSSQNFFLPEGKELLDLVGFLRDNEIVAGRRGIEGRLSAIAMSSSSPELRLSGDPQVAARGERGGFPEPAFL